MYTVLFVCTANICRTPMAHYYLRHLIAEAKLTEQIQVKSAGTWAVSGLPAAQFSEIVCANHGLDTSEHRSRSIDLPLMNSADVVLCMAVQHKFDLRQIFPHFRDKIFTLKEYARQDHPGNISIDDPYGKSMEQYRVTFEIISREVRRIFPVLQQNAREKLPGS